MSVSTRAVRGSATATAIDTSVNTICITEYWALSSGSIDQTLVSAHQATKKLIVVGNRRSDRERPDVRKRITKATRSISIGTRDPMSPKIPRMPLPANPTKNMPATV